MEGTYNQSVGNNSSVMTNEKYDIVTYATYQSVEKICHCVVTPVLYFLGAPANILCMIVFSKQGLRDRMNLCLFSLALSDFMFISSMFITFSYCFFAAVGSEVEETVKWYARKYLLGFIKGFMTVSGCLTTIIAVERCACVMLPMKAATIMTTKSMGTLILITVIILNLISSVLALKQSVKQVPTGILGNSKLVLVASDIYKENAFLFDVIENIVLTVIIFIDFIVVSFATIITVIKLQRVITWRKDVSAGSFIQDRRQVALVKMLVLVSCVYLTCSTLAVSLAVTRFVEEDFRFSGRYKNLFFATHAVALVVMQLNSSINFLVYVTQSTRFRQELKAMCIRHGNEQNEITMNTDTDRPAGSTDK